MTRKQIATLAAAADADVELTTSDIAARLRIINEAAWSRLRNLEDKGYVVQTQARGNWRGPSVYWRVTDAGHAALEQILSERSTEP